MTEFLCFWMLITTVVSVISLILLVLFRLIAEKWPEDKHIVIGTVTCLFWPILIIAGVCVVAFKISRAFVNVYNEYADKLMKVLK